MRVLGIDPGLNATGYGLVARSGRRLHLVEAGVIRPGSAALPLPQRLASLYDALAEALDALHPDALSIEEVFSHRAFPGTAVWMAHARGVLLLAAARHGAPVASYAPATVKKAIVGNGRATKAQVQHMVAQRLGVPSLPGPADVSDALALAITHLDASSLDLSRTMPAAAPAALRPSLPQRRGGGYLDPDSGGGWGAAL